MKNYEIFATRLKALRKEKRLTQKQLAEKVETSTASIISYENTQRFPSSAVIGLLSQHFNVSREYLLGETNERSLECACNDTEIMEAVRESFPKQLGDLNDILKDCSAEEQKLTFDILVQLRHVLTLKDASKKNAALSMIHNVAASVEHLTNDKDKPLRE